MTIYKANTGFMIFVLSLAGTDSIKHTSPGMVVRSKLSSVGSGSPDHDHQVSSTGSSGGYGSKSSPPRNSSPLHELGNVTNQMDDLDLDATRGRISQFFPSLKETPYEIMLIKSVITRHI